MGKTVREVFDVDSGVGTHVLMEEGLARANGTVVAMDSHMNILGALSAFEVEPMGVVQRDIFREGNLFAFGRSFSR